MEQSQQQNQEIDVIVGTYTQGTSKGIYQTKFDTNKKSLSNDMQLLIEIENPSFIHKIKENQFVAVSEKQQGQLVSLKYIDGKMQIVDIVDTLGSDPCYISSVLLQNQKDILIMVANYSSGNNFTVILDENLKFSNGKSYQQQLKFKKEHPRQESAHAHSITPLINSKYVLSCDLGCDQLFQYEINMENGDLNLFKQIDLPKGTGPRHLVYNDKYIFVVGELNSTLVVISREKDENLVVKNTISTLPQPLNSGFENYPSHIILNNNFVYVANRLADTICVYYIQEDDTLKVILNGVYGGKFPRHMEITPDKKFLLVANQHSDNISVLEINQENGLLQQIASQNSISTPSYIQF